MESSTYTLIFRNRSENRQTPAHCIARSRRILLPPDAIEDLAQRDRDLRTKVADLSARQRKASQDARRGAGRLMLVVLACSGLAGFLGLQLTAAALGALGAAVLLLVPSLRAFTNHGEHMP